MACQQPQQSAAGSATDATTDTSVSRSVVRYAKGFTLEYHNHYKLVRLFNPTASGTDTLRYLLVQRGYPAPDSFPGAQVIRVPLKTMVCMSTTHVGIADFVGVADRIVGLSNLQFITNPIVRNNIKTGKVVQVGQDDNLNNELVISLHPDLLMTMANPENAATRYKTLTDAGVPVLVNAEWLETTPLGRAEWVKLMAALVNKEDLVNPKFDSLEKAYNTLAQLGRSATVKPRIIIGMPYKGSWFVPAGDSYEAHFLRDAGTTYKWADSKGTGSLPLNFEAVAPEALQADFWLNPGGADSREHILSKDPRYASFAPYKTSHIFNNNKKMNDLGSNDYWESGLVHPQLILADLIRILHPDLEKGDTLVYYKQLN